MIVLTGDLHHTSLATRDQELLPETEPETAVTYARIAARHGVKTTLFVTGRTAAEEPAPLRKVLAEGNVELGGHGYYARSPRWLYGGVFHRLLGNGNGPAWYQDWEIRRTIGTIRGAFGVRIRSWRDHGYYHDDHTYRALERNGISVVSDEVGPARSGPTRVGPKLCSLPVNTLPDHDHVVHGVLTKAASGRRTLARSEFPPVVLTAEEWLSEVKVQICGIVEHGGVATVLAHPACMRLIDDFHTFKRLCAFIGARANGFVSDTPPATR